MKKLINNYKKWKPSSLAIILLFLVLFTFFLLPGFKLDNDFWFLINTGKTILKEGFIHIEPFTIHSGLSFIPQQWLTDIIFYFIYHIFGIRGIYYLVLLCDGIIVYLFYKISLLSSNNKKRAMIITSLISIFMLLWVGILTTRPQLFDIIVFSLELYLLELYIKKEKNNYIYFLPLLSLLLINYHASMWLMFFVLLVPYYIEFIILKIKKQKTYQIKPLVIITIISLIAGLINPYGIEAIKYLFNSYGVSKINDLIIEMQAVNITNFSGKVIFIVLFLGIYSFYRNKGNNKVRYFLLSIGIAYLTLSHYRGVLFLGVIMPLIFGYNFKKDKKDFDIKLRLLDKIVYIVGIIGISLVVIFFIPLHDGVQIKDFATYLDKNATYDIKLYTDYNDGSYMEYRGFKCYIDPRAEVFLKANNHVYDIFDEYYNLEKGIEEAKVFLEKYQFDYLLVSEDSYSLYHELKNNKEYEDVLSINDEKRDIMRHLYKNKGGEKNEKSN